jgi:class 3 adenylate cyclase
VLLVEPETQYARVGDAYVGYQVFGHGPLDVVFIPAWNSNIDVMWEDPWLARFLRRLASFARVITFDKRGTGISGPVPLAAFAILEQWADDVISVMDTVGSKRAAVITHAEGGPMTILFAASHPERTSALVLMETFACFQRAANYPHGLPVNQVERFLQNFEDRWGTGINVDQIAPGRAADAQFRRWYGRYERVGLARGMCRTVYRSVALGVDIRPLLPTIRVPTLVLHSRGNRHIRVGHGQYLAAHITGAKYVELPGEDHLFYAGDMDRRLDEIEEFLTGERSVFDTDRVFATILFTDMVRSTEHAAELGDRRWRELLDDHDARVRRELERHRGRLVHSTGDGVLATFDGPARAIRCSDAITRSIRELGIEVRSGLHAGEIEQRGDDIGGIAVHLAARVMETAQPGEVIVSSTVKDLVVGSGLHFVERGVHALKGVPGEWRLFAVET